MRPRAAQQLGGQVVAHARDVELLLDRLAQTCESLAAWVRACVRRGSGRAPEGGRSAVRTGAAFATGERARTVLRDSHGHLSLLARLASRHVGLQERLRGWGRVHIPWGVPRVSWFLCTLSEGVTIPSEMSLMLASASSAVRKKNCAFSFSTRENLL